MDLIERYVAEVARRLPRRMRGDVAAELRSSLTDAHEAMVDAHGAQVTDKERETIAAKVLQQFGPPSALAASYRPGPQWLIGPELYPAFLLTLRIVVLAVVGVVALAAVAGSIGEPHAWTEIMRRITTAELLSSVVSSLGWVVLVFWIIELLSWRRRGTGAALDVLAAAPASGPESSDWDPYDLPRADDPDRIGRNGVKVEIAIMLGLIILFGVFPRSIGASVSVNGERGWVALLGPGFLDHRALLFIGFAGVALVNMVLLWNNRWGIGTRLADLAFNILFIVVLSRIIAAGEIVAVQPLDLMANGWSPEAARDLAAQAFPLLDGIVRVAFAGILIGIAAQTIARASTLVKQLAR